MTLTNEVLENRSSAPSQTEMDKIKHTHELIRWKLEAYLPVDEIKRQYQLSSYDYETYLQWSYANSTNISFTSDIDIVIELKSVIYNDTSLLSDEEKLEHSKVFLESKYQFAERKNSVYSALVEAFGVENVEFKNKAILVKWNSARIDADIVPCFEYRKYKRFHSIHDSEYYAWIKLFDTWDWTEIINFPKMHLENCTSKNTATDGNFKSMIRAFKRIKEELISKSMIQEDLVSSYNIENLLYNCTDHCFSGNTLDNFLEILEFIYLSYKNWTLSSFICANEQFKLFDNWDTESAIQFILSCHEFYKNY